MSVVQARIGYCNSTFIYGAGCPAACQSFRRESATATTVLLRRKLGYGACQSFRRESATATRHERHNGQRRGGVSRSGANRLLQLTRRPTCARRAGSVSRSGANRLLQPARTTRKEARRASVSRSGANRLLQPVAGLSGIGVLDVSVVQARIGYCNEADASDRSRRRKCQSFRRESATATTSRPTWPAPWPCVSRSGANRLLQLPRWRCHLLPSRCQSFRRESATATTHRLALRTTRQVSVVQARIGYCNGKTEKNARRGGGCQSFRRESATATGVGSEASGHGGLVSVVQARIGYCNRPPPKTLAHQ